MTARIPVAALAALATLAVAAPARASLNPRGVRPVVDLPAAAQLRAASVEPATWLVGARAQTRRVDALARAHGARRVTGRAYVVGRERARSFATALRSPGLLAYAEANRRSTPRQSPTDPLSVVPQAGWREHVVAGAVAPPVDAASPLIALIDSELDPQHPEVLGSNTATAGGAVLADFHGTATATVAAAPQNGIGIVGIWPNARTLNLPLPADISCSDSARQIAAAVEAGAVVVNMSYGSSTACRTEYEAIQRAISRGVVAVAAAGNEFGQGNPAEFPASLPHVLTVAATGSDNTATFFSNQNAAVDLSAPGEDVLAGVPAAFDPDGHPDGFATVSGTSFSAPMVAAAVAWVRAARPELTADQAAQVVRLGAQDVGRPGWEASTGYGVLNLPGALAHEAPTADPLEPNDDVEFVNGSVLGRRSRPVFTGAAASLVALLDRYEDPVDVYRILIPARATVRIRLVPAFGDPDLFVYTPAARTVTGSRALVGRSMRRGRRVDGVVLANPLPRRVTRFVAVALGDGVASLDAGYTLRVMRR